MAEDAVIDVDRNGHVLYFAGWEFPLRAGAVPPSVMQEFYCAIDGRTIGEWQYEIDIATNEAGAARGEADELRDAIESIWEICDGDDSPKSKIEQILGICREL